MDVFCKTGSNLFAQYKSNSNHLEMIKRGEINQILFIFAYSMDTTSNKWLGKVWLIGVFIFSIVFKYFLLQKNDLSNDEIFSIYHAQMPLNELFRELSTGNNPPLFESILIILLNSSFSGLVTTIGSILYFLHN